MKFSKNKVYIKTYIEIQFHKMQRIVNIVQSNAKINTHNIYIISKEDSRLNDHLKLYVKFPAFARTFLLLSSIFHLLYHFFYQAPSFINSKVTLYFFVHCIVLPKEFTYDNKRCHKNR